MSSTTALADSAAIIRPARPPRAPAHTGRYRFSSLVNLPNRIAKPGELIERQLEQRPQLYGKATATEVRGGHVKLSEVQLEDVISGKYTTPLSLKDFEDYLCFRTKSAENLYLSIWYKAYAGLYNSSSPSNRPHQDVLALSASYKVAVDTFFSARSPLELNIPSDMRRQIDGLIDDTARQSVLSPSSETFLPPSAFEPSFNVASESLALSFKSFLQQSARNADRNRGWFAIFLGAATWALGLLPTIVCTVLDKHRAWRAIGIPFWLLGVIVLVGGLKQTCLVLYLHGDHRQLYPWELARETDAGSSFGSETTMTGLEEGKWETSSGSSSPNPEDAASRRSSSIFPDLNYFPLPRASSLSEKSVKSSTATTQGGLYFAPSYINESLPSSSRVWAPFTPMLSPVVARAQRDKVMAAAGYGLVATVLTTAICLSVPNRHA